MRRPMLLAAALTLLVSIPAGAQAAQCADPTPADSAWWRWIPDHRTDGMVSASAPEPPPQRAGFRPTSLNGWYRMRLVPTVGPDRGRIYEGSISLYIDKLGVAAAPAGWPPYLSFAPDTNARPNEQPAEVYFDSESRRLSVTLGNPGLRWTDSGVDLMVFEASDSLIVGRWIDGGLFVFGGPEGPHPQGWFCLSQ